MDFQVQSLAEEEEIPHRHHSTEGSPCVARDIKTEETPRRRLRLKPDILTGPDHMVLRHLDRTLIKRLHSGKILDTVACILCADLMV
ncbi:hypothetical protein AMELA_G00138380 [Ameiurus melas]|uniref:Uncharacterized protein n=1 Tax=Ameiurus melas TaxID=219545 RepID=A0A7J6AMJ4_AMEME|nr:hypothetical protein AMELA_G00138380 [Ameiurus melas]